MSDSEPPATASELGSYIIENAIGFEDPEEFRVGWDGDCSEFSKLLVLGCSSFGRFAVRIVREAIEWPERRVALKPAVDSAFDAP